jgi:EmrB/QacA subfamily drug resistance transporter
MSQANYLEGAYLSTSPITADNGLATGVGSLAAADPRRWLALGVMCFTVLLISLDATVLNVALPTLVVNLHPSASGVQWIADCYVLTEAVLLLLCGALGDRFGRRRTFLVGVLIFGAGSAGCALVHSTGPLIGARATTGLGAALLMPATLSLIAATFPPAERPRAIGIWAGMSGIGTAAGPLLGGWLLQNFWWGSVFIINVPIAILAFFGGILFLSESRADKKPPIDPVGVALSAIGLAAITYGLIEAPELGWLSPTVLGTLVAGTVLVVGFVWWDERQAHPLVDFTLFKNPTFSTGLTAITAAFFALFGIGYLLSQYIQFVQRATVLQVGLRFLPMAAGTLVGANTATRLSVRFGKRAVIVTGMLGIACGLGIYSVLPVTTNPIPLGIAFTLVGTGLGLTIAPSSNAIISSLPPDQVGVGSGLRSTVQLLAGSFGVAILGNLATSRYRSGIAAAWHGPLRQVPASVRPAISNQIGGAVIVSRTLPAGLAGRVTAASDRAFVSGVRLGARVDLVMMAVAIVAVARYIPGGRGSELGGHARETIV